MWDEKIGQYTTGAEMLKETQSELDLGLAESRRKSEILAKDINEDAYWSGLQRERNERLHEKAVDVQKHNQANINYALEQFSDIIESGDYASSPNPASSVSYVLGFLQKHPDAFAGQIETCNVILKQYQK